MSLVLLPQINSGASESWTIVLALGNCENNVCIGIQYITQFGSLLEYHSGIVKALVIQATNLPAGLATPGPFDLRVSDYL